LDPKWMVLLKFYLGEDFYKLFDDPGHRGVIRSDGFGEISTTALEETLHLRLSLLISAIRGIKTPVRPLERFVAYELKGVKGKPGVGFQSYASYLEQSDPEFIITHKPQDVKPDPEIARDIDVLICAGGKSSPMKEMFLPSSIAVTEKQNY